MKKRDIEILSQKSSTHQQTVAKEEAETNEMKTAIASLSAQRDAHVATRDSLKQQIADTQKQIDIRLAAQRAHAQHIEPQAQANAEQRGIPEKGDSSLQLFRVKQGRESGSGVVLKALNMRRLYLQNRRRIFIFLSAGCSILKSRLRLGV